MSIFRKSRDEFNDEPDAIDTADYVAANDEKAVRERQEVMEKIKGQRIEVRSRIETLGGERDEAIEANDIDRLVDLGARIEGLKSTNMRLDEALQEAADNLADAQYNADIAASLGKVEAGRAASKGFEELAFGRLFPVLDQAQSVIEELLGLKLLSDSGREEVQALRTKFQERAAPYRQQLKAQEAAPRRMDGGKVVNQDEMNEWARGLKPRAVRMAGLPPAPAPVNDPTAMFAGRGDAKCLWEFWLNARVGK